MQKGGYVKGCPREVATKARKAYGHEHTCIWWDMNSGHIITWAYGVEVAHNINHIHGCNVST